MGRSKRRAHMATLPGFSAEAGLSPSHARRRSTSCAEELELGRKVFPQLPPVTFNYCDPWQGCIRLCCDVTIEYVGPYNIPKVTKFCSTQRKPSLQCMLGGRSFG